jgi:iron(III) transport system permease protein
MRQVTFGLAAPGIGRAAVLVLGLCLADVTVPVLLGGDAQVLATAIVAAAGEPTRAAGAALVLGVLTLVVAGAAAPWRAGPGAPVALGRRERTSPSIMRRGLGVGLWAVALGLVGLWTGVPLGSILSVADTGVTLEHWRALGTPATAEALENSVGLALAVAGAGTALALVAAWAVERRRTSAGRTVELLARLPLLVPGLVGGVGYLLLVTPTMAAGTLVVLVAVVACWELPVTVRAARQALADADRSLEDAAISLGAGSLSTLTRVVAPTLRPAAGWIIGHLLAAGVLAIGTVIVLVPAGRTLGALTMLALAADGATGAACAVATALLALAGGAVLLGRAIAGRRHGPTSFA